MLLRSTDGIERVLSLSYGKDSLACLGALEELGWPLDRIVHAEVWATDTIPADLPPMVEFKAKADAIIKARYDIVVEHICAMKEGEKQTYESIFYRQLKPKRERERDNFRYAGSPVTIGLGAWTGSKQERSTRVYGWPIIHGQWCNSMLKLSAIRMAYQHQTRQLVYSSQTEGFLAAPERGARKISFNTLESQQMSPHVSKFCPFQRLARLLLQGGMKPDAASGAKKIICFPQYIPLPRGGAAGFATTKVLGSCGYLEKIIPICGH